MDESSIDLGTGLADLTTVLLDDLRTAGDSPLAHSVRRVLRESEDGHHTVVAGHETHI